MLDCEGMKPFGLKSQKAEKTSGDFLRDLARRPGPLRLLSFPGFLCRSKEILKKIYKRFN